MKKLPFGKKKKLRKLSALKREAWQTFSEFIRRREADQEGIISCITCSAKIHWKNANASHYLHGHSKPTFFDPRNVHGSCIRCNLYLSGNLIEYSVFMKNRYGWETIDALRELSHQVVKFNRDYYQEIIDKYKDEIRHLDEMEVLGMGIIQMGKYLTGASDTDGRG